MRPRSRSTKENPRVVAHLPFVEQLARRVAATMPHSIDIGDLVQDAAEVARETRVVAKSHLGWRGCRSRAADPWNRGFQHSIHVQGAAGCTHCECDVVK